MNRKQGQRSSRKVTISSYFASSLSGLFYLNLFQISLDIISYFEGTKYTSSSHALYFMNFSLNFVPKIVRCFFMEFLQLSFNHLSARNVSPKIHGLKLLFLVKYDSKYIQPITELYKNRQTK